MKCPLKKEVVKIDDRTITEFRDCYKEECMSFVDGTCQSIQVKNYFSIVLAK